MTDSSAPTTLYRLYDAEDALLYVGIAGNPGRRWEQHRKDKPWWGDVASTRLEHFATREEAAAAELEAIRTEDPLHNVAGRPKPHLVTVDLPPGPPRLTPAGARALAQIVIEARDTTGEDPATTERYARVVALMERLNEEDEERHHRERAMANFPDLFPPKGQPGGQAPPGYQMEVGEKTPRSMGAVPIEELDLDPTGYPDLCEACSSTGRNDIRFPHMAQVEPGGLTLRAIYRCPRHCSTWIVWWAADQVSA